MSGIVGILNLNGEPVDQHLLMRMTNFMSYRGPDAQRIWIDGSVGLGHSLLRTTNRAEIDDQPLSLDGKVWLIADARIDAREELVQKLEGKLTRSLSRTKIPSDAELILLAFQAWDEECIKYLIGDFAFAIYDLRSRRLFCARDHLGVKPFFYAHKGESFLFSNTLNVLRIDPRVSDTLNEMAIGDYLLFGHNQDLSTTTFLDINRLPPGHTLTVSPDGLKIRRYWAPATTNEVRYRQTRSYLEHFAELLTQATKDRLFTERVAISMSGGLDSTSLAAIARELLKNGRDVHAYSVVYDSLISDDERHYSQVAAEHLGIPITHINADHFTLFDEQTEGEMNQPEPFLISPLTGQFNTLLRLCAGYGRVALTGYDGDTLMNERASNYIVSAAKRRRLRALTYGLGWYVANQKRLPRFGVRTRLRQIVGKREAASFYPEWMDETFSKRINLRERSEEVSATPIKTGEERPDALRALASKVWAPLFEGYDAGTTRLPLEFRHPFIDLRLVEFLLSIPAIPWCVDKHILRVAMKNRLPADVLNRPKTPLGGDPALQMSRRASVRCLDRFEESPQLRRFVNLDLRRPISDEQTPDSLWASLRVIALNYWLLNCQPIVRIADEGQTSKIEMMTETSMAQTD